MEMVAILALVLAAVLLGGPILALAAFLRVRQLEQRVARLEGRVAATAAPDPVPVAEPSGHSPVVAAPAPAPAPGPAVAEPVLVAAMAHVGHDAATARSTATPAPSSASTTFDWEAIVAGQWLNRIGLLAVAIGVSYFLKYAIDNAWIGPRGQVAAGLLAGAGLIVWSDSLLRRGLRYFADGITALGATVLYLSLWAAASYYEIASPALAFVAMIAVTASVLAIAIGRNSQRLAVLALIGGFIAPALVSTGRDAQVVLFLYLALHNAALLVPARTRDWRVLELPAFAFTQLYFWGWYDQFYTDAAAMRTLMFAALFFTQFLVLPVLRARGTGVPRPEQGLLILANAAAFLLVLHALFWPDARWTLTLATLALAIVHLVFARFVPAAAVQARVLFAGLALTLATLVIPIRLEGQWITMAWAVEAAVLAWSGFALRIWHLRAAAYVVLLAVALRLSSGSLPAATFLWNARLATAVVVAASAIAVVWRARQSRADLSASEPVIIGVLAVAANALMLWALTLEVGLYFLDGGMSGQQDGRLAHSLSISLLWTVYATTLVLVGARVGTAALRWQGLALFGMTTVKVFLADLGYLSGIYRIVSSIALGVVLLMVSFLYQRSIVARRAKDGPAS